jgi:2-amino-4-hydroxy-6-hydroxymethyldihydropteridine diphosphokinase
MILIAIGANLPAPDGRAPIETCRQAATALDALPGLRLQGLSRWYLTAPVPPSGQPHYVNGVAALWAEPGSAGPDPDVLLAALQAIEAEAGRSRSAPNAARTLDLDIIAMGPCGQLVRTTPDPVLPHPRAHERAFVLVPLLDVAPDWFHPQLRRRARELLAAVPQQGLRPL